MDNENSLKSQAEGIMASISQNLQEATSSTTPEAAAEIEARADRVMDTLFGVVSDVDVEASAERVAGLRQQYPNAAPMELAQKLIRDKCQKTGAVGAVTSGAGLIPGVGTAAALTLGVAADIGATFKLQAELVLEIAALYDHPLTQEEKQRLVMLITGLSVGATTLTARAGRVATLKIGERFAGRAFLKALPVVGVISSAGTNVLSTYIIGQRADAYFRLGPEAVGSWADSLRAVSGVDERKIVAWLSEGGKATGAAVARGAGRVSQAGRTAGGVVATKAGNVAKTTGPVIASGAKKAGSTAQHGVKAYFNLLISFWKGVFSLPGAIFGFIWTAVTFIPRKVAGFFGKNK